MKRSAERILTTHTGSLPRPPDLVAQVVEEVDQRKLRFHPAFESQVKQAVAAIVRKQAAAGVDILNDGEMSKRGFSAYITERVTGFDGPLRRMPPWIEMGMFPEYTQSVLALETRSAITQGYPACNGPITWRGEEYVRSDKPLPTEGPGLQIFRNAVEYFK